MTDLKVGDEVMLCGYRSAHKTRVSKVGRKYVQAEGAPNVMFHLGSLKGVESNYYLLMPADHARRLCIEAACSQLETFGIQLQHGHRGSRLLAPEILAAVLPVLTPTREDKP